MDIADLERDSSLKFLINLALSPHHHRSVYIKLVIYPVLNFLYICHVDVCYVRYPVIYFTIIVQSILYICVMVLCKCFRTKTWVYVC